MVLCVVYFNNMVNFCASAVALALAGAPLTEGFGLAPAARQFRVAAPLAMSSVAAEQPPLAPPTVWGDRIPDIASSQEEMRGREIDFAPTIKSSELGLSSDDVEGQLSYVRDHAMEIKQQMVDSGAVIFRGFDLMKSQEGFVKFYEALGMKTCLDPLHSVSARPTVDGSKKSAVYEAVNKESRANFYIGMHNEFVGTRAPRAAMFVCFKQAEEGGEVMVADGVERLYERQIRYSVMELPFFSFLDRL